MKQYLCIKDRSTPNILRWNDSSLHAGQVYQIKRYLKLFNKPYCDLGNSLIISQSTFNQHFQEIPDER
ncbi:MAG: hypothetical protein DRI46_10125 [Chloroflexi bacterium]|nr:MAG: hypothetical protein DRI46_10125 [Chloroflexota bacterium]